MASGGWWVIPHVPWCAVTIVSRGKMSAANPHPVSSSFVVGLTSYGSYTSSMSYSSLAFHLKPAPIGPIGLIGPIGPITWRTPRIAAVWSRQPP